MAGLSIRGVTKRFGTAVAVDAVDLELPHGAFCAILGPSGCGKTTLLRLLAGFETPDAGAIALDGRELARPGAALPPQARGIGMVFQSYALWPHMTVAGNVGFGLEVRGVPRGERRRRVADALAMVGLAELAGRRPAELSGGQRQRVALARCLVLEPRLVLMDEPLANLDVHLRDTMREEFQRFHAVTGATMVYVTHDQSEALALADLVAVMDRGRIRQLAAPGRLYREPADAMVAAFVGRGAVVPAEVLGAGLRGTRVRVFGSVAEVRGNGPAGPALLCLRPEDLALAEQGESGFAARVAGGAYEGAVWRVRAAPHAAPATSLTLELPARPEGDIRVRICDGWLLPERPGVAT
jgi:iron(III) transport system ATP-binding protein